MTKNTLLTTLLILMSMNIVIKSQTLNLGIRYEPGILFTEQDGKGESVPAIFSVSGNVVFGPIEWLDIEVRPGLVFIDEEYSGFEIGLFSRVKILQTGFYIITGINNHFNKSYSSNSGGSYDKNILYKSIGTGYVFSSKFNVDLMYYWTSDKSYAYNRETDWLTYSRRVDKQMNGILKVGVNLSWDIL